MKGIFCKSHESTAFTQSICYRDFRNPTFLYPISGIARMDSEDGLGRATVDLSQQQTRNVMLKE